MAHIVSALLGSSDGLDEKMATLKRKLQALESKKDDVREDLEQQLQRFPTKKQRKEVHYWLAEVDRIKTQVQQLNERKLQGRSSWWRNPELHRRVDKLTIEVKDLTEQSRFPSGLTLESNDRERVPFLAKRLIGEKFEKNKKMIRDSLMDGEDSIIAIYGMGGVGKTTLLTHIRNELVERSVDVSWVTVSRDSNTRKLQCDIAKTLYLDISEENDERKRAAKLALAMSQRRNFILILDDVWDHIPLDEVGIRVGVNNSKLVLTTRSSIVCRGIGCQKNIKVEPLSVEEAWTLFMETLGNQTSVSPQIEEMAKALVEECGGLPLGVITMAGSMRGVEDIREWRHALEEMRSAKYADMEPVFRVLEYSYRKLNGAPKVQECFLYCCLYPEDQWISRDDLIELFIDEKLVDGTKSRESQLDEGHVILNRLENICLLERRWDNRYNYVKMHDLVRDMAIKVSSKSPHRFLVKSGMQLTDMPNEEEWSEDLRRVSLRSNNIRSIPSYSSPKFPKLLTLLLCQNAYLKVIPKLYFIHMKSLTVLDLSDTDVESLPSSISDLDSLTALLLRGCHRLRSMPNLENLAALRRLDLWRTAIDEVPRSLGKLINLKYLRMSSPSLSEMPDGILSELSHMECFESDWTSLRGEEIGGWKKLETFYGRFSQIRDLNSCVESWKESEPAEYGIFVGDCCGKPSVTCRNVWVSKAVCTEDTFLLPRGICFLQLEDCDGITCLSHIATLREATDLLECRISGCKSMRRMICSCCCNVPFFQSLEVLQVGGLPMLTDLVEQERSTSWALPTNTFSYLKDLTIWNCDGLKRLFMPVLLSHLQSLERCDVSGCRRLVEIIGEASDEDENKETTTVISMPSKLQFLRLHFLPELKSLCNSSIILPDSLRLIDITNCRRLIRMTLLCKEPDPLPSFKEFRVQKDWWDSVEWKHPETKHVLQHYVHFYSQLQS